jgi:predicted RNase H-like HicB family nuclease
LSSEIVPSISQFIKTGDEVLRFIVTIDRDEDGVWIVECPAIPGCVSQGTTKDEAMQNAKDAIVACLAVRSERGLPLTIETQHVEVVAQ